MSTKNYVSVRLKALTLAKAVNQLAHDTRHRLPGYVDTPDIDVITAAGTTHNDEAYEALRAELATRRDRQNADYLRTKGRRRPSNALPYVSGIITFTEVCPETQKDLDAKAREYLNRLCQYYDCELVYLSVHKDEKTPHYHFLVENVDSKSESVRRKMTRQSLAAVQDLAGEVFASLGYARGERSGEGTQPRKHYSVREGHKRELAEFATQISALKQERKEILHQAHQLAADRDQVLQDLREAEAELRIKSGKINEYGVLLQKNEHKKKLIEGEKAKLEAEVLILRSEIGRLKTWADTHYPPDVAKTYERDKLLQGIILSLINRSNYDDKSKTMLMQGVAHKHLADYPLGVLDKLHGAVAPDGDSGKVSGGVAWDPGTGTWVMDIASVKTLDRD